uniref:Helicase domain-containing protein n=1 Tax=Solanum tuberosum TaxID=4113 RepID=M1CBN2_SOLTU
MHKTSGRGKSRKAGGLVKSNFLVRIMLLLLLRLLLWLKELLMSVVNLHQVQVSPWLVTKFALIVEGMREQSSSFVQLAFF